jgi:hypothetical protein
LAVVLGLFVARMRRTVPARHGAPVLVGSRSVLSVAAIAP